MLWLAHHLEILGTAIRPVAVDVVDLLAGLETTPKLLFGYDTMFVRVATHVGEMMITSDANEHVAVGGD